MKDYDCMNPISARRVIQYWLQDIKNKREQEQMGQAMVQAYARTRATKQEIFDLLDGDPENPETDERRFQD